MTTEDKSFDGNGCGPEWRQVRDWPYEVSSDGQIRHCFTNGSIRIIKPTSAKHGYPRVNLNSKQKRRRGICIHVLVAEAFLGRRPDGYHVNHIDGVKGNNHHTNLEYVTPRENLLHAWRLGLYARRRPRRPSFSASSSEDSRFAKLNVEQVKEIKKRLAQGEKGYAGIGRAFGVTGGAIWRIWRGDTWKQIQL